MSTPAPPRLMTAEEFMQLPDDPDGRQMELYDGEVIYMPPPGEEHGTIGRAIARALFAFAERHRLGEAWQEVGFRIRTAPDRVVAPDVSFIPFDQLPADRDRRSAVPVPPWLAVEVVSPNDLDRDVDAKTSEYMEAGTRRVWVVRPSRRNVTVHFPGGVARRFEAGAVLTSEDAGFEVAGFELPVGQIFA